MSVVEEISDIYKHGYIINRIEVFETDLSDIESVPKFGRLLLKSFESIDTTKVVYILPGF